MRNSFRITVAIFVSAVFLCSLLLAGCADGEEINTPDVKAVGAPAEIKYVIWNPLIIEEISGTKHEGHQNPYDCNYVQISGLADKDIEKKVNDRLEEVHHMYDDGSLPPYTGIKATLTDDLKLYSRHIDMYVCANYNNILSVQTYFSWEFKNGAFDEKNRKYFRTRCIEACNFDLNTGEEFTLADVFRDDVDYQQKINDFVVSEINRSEQYGGEYRPFALRAPFRGIREDQPFLMQYGTIRLLFDYRTPAFDTGFYSLSADMSFGDDLAITERFYDADKNIYISQEPPVKMFVRKRTDTAEFAEGLVSKSERYEKDGIEITLDYSYRDDYPGAVKEAILELKKPDETMLAEIRDEKNKAIREGIDAPDASYLSNMNISENGDIININVLRSGRVELGLNIIFDVWYPTALCYRGNDPKPLDLNDIFVQGANVGQLMKDAMKTALRRAQEENQLELGTGIEAYVDEIYDKIVGFTVNESHLSLYFLETDDQVPWQASDISYRDIGCDNLNIFD